MKRRHFSLDDQLEFARVSGDFNPQHIDPVLARRLIFGRPVVHGIHALLWAIDCWLEESGKPVRLTRLKAVFKGPVIVDQQVEFRLIDSSGGEARMEVSVGDSTAVAIELGWKNQSSEKDPVPLAKSPARREPKILMPEDTAGAEGTLDLTIDPEAVSSLVPAASRCIPVLQLAEIISTTRLVGMECPGLNSIYHELDARFGNESSDRLELRYRVSDFDDRFKAVVMDLSAPRMNATIRAFLRPEPREQASFEEIQKLVERDEFGLQRALVVGGGRGLGEVTAKLLAAGGAEVGLTYFRGEADAARVVRDVVEHGGAAFDFFLDVRASPIDLSRSLPPQWQPTHLYYYATPFIFAGKRGAFSAQLFRDFCDYYVEGFLRVVTETRRISPGCNTVLYPSSVAIDELPTFMGEYAAAKAAGEKLCEFLEKIDKDLRIFKPRLPRMATDQTVSIYPVENKDPASTVLRVLRASARPGPRSA